MNSIVFIVLVQPAISHQKIEFFRSHMTRILSTDFPIAHKPEFYFVKTHPSISIAFTDGCLKNIGFWIAKQVSHSKDYKECTFVFHDIGHMPISREIIPSYETNSGVVKHWLGTKQTLDGIVCIQGQDFETIGGFPFTCESGSESYELYKRVQKCRQTDHLHLDQTELHPWNDLKFIHTDANTSIVVNGDINGTTISETTDIIETRMKSFKTRWQDQIQYKHERVTRIDQVDYEENNQYIYVKSYSLKSIYTDHTQPITTKPTGELFSHHLFQS